jgi:hypothetical protein
MDDARKKKGAASLVTKERPNATFKAKLQEFRSCRSYRMKIGIVLRAIIF